MTLKTEAQKLLDTEKKERQIKQIKSRLVKIEEYKSLIAKMEQDIKEIEIDPFPETCSSSNGYSGLTISGGTNWTTCN